MKTQQSQQPSRSFADSSVNPAGLRNVAALPLVRIFMKFLDWLIDTYLSDFVVTRQDYDVLAGNAGEEIERTVYRNAELHSRLDEARKEYDFLKEKFNELRTDTLRDNGWLVGEQVSVEAMSVHQRDRFMYRFGIEISDDLIRMQREQPSKLVMQYALEQILQAVKTKFVQEFMERFSKAA